MLLLTSTSDLISVVTGQVASIDVHASWVDYSAGAITPGRTNTATISGATTTTVVGSPASSTQRNVKALAVRNRHASTACDVTVKHTDGTNNLELIKVTLQPGEQLLYEDGQGFSVLLAVGSLKTGFDPSNVALTGGSISGANLTSKTGTAAVAGLHIPSGIVTTSALAGDIEFDGDVMYATYKNGERQIIDADQFITTQGGSFTLANQTAAQKMFNSPSSGALTVPSTRTYTFECQFDLSSMSAVSGAFGWALLGTATFTVIKWWSEGNKATLATAASAQNTANATAANTAIVSATTGTIGWAVIRGILRVNAGGTIIPAISLGQAAAAVVGRDSYFFMRPLGAGGVTSVGNWT